jgi:hypothetical protein
MNHAFWEKIMSARRLSGLGLFVALVACGTEANVARDTPPNQSGTALQALQAAGAQAAARCTEAVTRCNGAQLVDAGSSEVCQQLSQHCDTLQQHLAEVQAHAVGCLNHAQACEEHAADPAQCMADVTSCQALADGASEDGSLLVACSDKVQKCLTRVASLPASAAGSCDHISAACERVSALLQAAEDARANGSPGADEQSKRAQDEVENADEDAAGDDASDSDEDGRVDAGADQNHGKHLGRSDAGAGHGQKAAHAVDAGAQEPDEAG